MLRPHPLLTLLLRTLQVRPVQVRHWLALDDMELTSSASSLVNALMAQHVIQTDPECAGRVWAGLTNGRRTAR